MSILLACVLTVLIETPYLALWGYRSRGDVAVTAAANVLTNLTLNLSFLLFLPNRMSLILVGEVLVVAAEYAIYALAFGRSWKLFRLTLSANCLSFGIGLFLRGVLRLF